MSKPRSKMNEEELARARARDKERYQREKEDAVSEAERIVSSIPGVQPDIEIAESAQESSSLKERLLGKLSSFGAPGQAPGQPSPRSRSAKKKDNLISAVLPTVLAAFIATYSAQLIDPPYNACCPSESECSAILTPVLSIISRRVEISGKASQDAIDSANTLIAALMFGTRSYITYTMIKGDHKDVRRKDTQEDTRVNGRSTSNDESKRRTGNHSDGLSADSEIPGTDAHSDAEKISNLLERDKQGRLERGFLTS